MKTVSLKQLSMVLVLCGLIGACGKDNKAAAPNSGVPNIVNFGNNSPVNISSSFQNIKNRVIANQFRQKISSSETYHFENCTNSVSTGSWWIFDFNSYNQNCGNSFTRSYGSVSIQHEYGNSVEAVRAQLSNLINSAVDVNGATLTDSYVEFKANDGYIYIYNLNYPIIANPMSRRSANGSSYYYFSYLSGF